METIRIPILKYFLILLEYLFLFVSAVLLALYSVHYATTEDVIDFNVYFVATITFCFVLLYLIFLKGAKMPIEISFYEYEAVLSMCYFFWKTNKTIPYSSAEIHFNQSSNSVELLYGTRIIRFDPLLWSKKDRLAIVEKMKQHQVIILTS